jgi:hypothetical protein
MRTPRLGRDRSGEPRWRITGELPFPLLGQTLHKTGAVSGWTSGPVVATCVDVQVAETDIVLLCQDVVIAGVRGGDSGAPVFQRLSSTSSDIRIAGVLWGVG